MLKLLFAVCACWCSIAVAQELPPAGYKLVWSDEFNYTGRPDPSKWTYDKGFIRNNEPQMYTSRLENARVDNGYLIIEARKEHLRNPDFDPSAKAGSNQHEYGDYTSACLVTAGHASWLYGRIEVRAKVPTGKGDWPAIWMMGDTIVSKTHHQEWPLCGETDIMESWGAKDPNVVQAHVFYQHDGKQKSEGAPITIESPSKVFHVYAVEWTPQRLDFFVDHLKYLTINIDQSRHIEGDAFRRPQYLLLNLALEPIRSKIDPVIFPQQFIIDYVRVFQKNQ